MSSPISSPERSKSETSSQLQERPIHSTSSSVRPLSRPSVIQYVSPTGEISSCELELLESQTSSRTNREISKKIVETSQAISTFQQSVQTSPGFCLRNISKFWKQHRSLAPLTRLTQQIGFLTNRYGLTVSSKAFVLAGISFQQNLRHNVHLTESEERTLQSICDELLESGGSKEQPIKTSFQEKVKTNPKVFLTEYLDKTPSKLSSIPSTSGQGDIEAIAASIPLKKTGKNICKTKWKPTLEQHTLSLLSRGSLNAHPIFEPLAQIIEGGLTSNTAEACLSVWKESSALITTNLISHSLLIKNSHNNIRPFEPNQIIQSLSLLHRARTSSFQPRTVKKVAPTPMSKLITDRLCAILVSTIEALYAHPIYRNSLFYENCGGQPILHHKVLYEILALLTIGCDFTIPFYFNAVLQNGTEKPHRLMLSASSEQILQVMNALKAFIKMSLDLKEEESPEGLKSDTVLPVLKGSKSAIFIFYFPTLETIFSGSATKTISHQMLRSKIEIQRSAVKRQAQELLEGISLEKIEEKMRKTTASTSSTAQEKELKLLKAVLQTLSIPQPQPPFCLHEAALRQQANQPPCPRCVAVFYSLQPKSPAHAQYTKLLSSYSPEDLAEALLKAGITFDLLKNHSACCLTNHQLAYIHYLLSDPTTAVSNYRLDPRSHAPLYLSFAKTQEEGLSNPTVNMCVRAWNHYDTHPESLDAFRRTNIFIMDENNLLSLFDPQKLFQSFDKLEKTYSSIKKYKPALQTRSIQPVSNSTKLNWVDTIGATLQALNQMESLQKDFFSFTDQNQPVCTSKQLLEVACAVFSKFENQRIFVPPSIESLIDRENLTFKPEDQTVIASTLKKFCDLILVQKQQQRARKKQRV